MTARKNLLRSFVLAAAGLASAAVFVSCQEGGTPARKAVLVNRETTPVYADAAPTTQPEWVEGRNGSEGQFPKMTRERAVMMGYSYPPAPPMTVRPLEKTGDAAEDLGNYELVSVKTMNANCVACHTGYEDSAANGDDAHMHGPSANISCVDCHGGNWKDFEVPAGITNADPSFDALKNRAHVLPNPKTASLWMTGARLSSANPEIPGAMTLDESPDYIRFVNPGDLNAAHVACYNCHADIVEKGPRSMMAHGGMLWGAALYNNGAINRKNPLYGEAYGPQGEPRVLAYASNPDYLEKTKLPGPPTAQETMERGILPFLYPLPRWEVSQPGNILRVFERGGRLLKGVEVANPNILIDIDPGRPDVKLSTRGFGTQVRTDPVFIGLQKTRLLDPTLTHFGTNDHPGDYRASGCSACHVVYANDRSPVHSGKWAEHGNLGHSATGDPTIPRGESGHPIQHVFVKAPPTSSCIVCHIHPGTLVLNTYLGYTWWDNETDAEVMYPRKQQYLTGDEEVAVNKHNPEQAATRGLWSNQYPNEENHLGMKAGEDFLERIYTDVNPQLKHTQFADFHGHGWVFRAVFKQDRHGRMLDRDGDVVENVDAAKMKAGIDYQWQKDGDRPPDGMPVHMKDIHLEVGMHCTDCHFASDSHGDGNLYGEARNAVNVECIDCHGSPKEEAVILQYLKIPLNRRNSPDGKALLDRAFTGNAAATMTDGHKRAIISKFELDRATRSKLIQKGSVDSSRRWTVSQATDGLDRAKMSDSERNGLYAHTVRVNGKWGTTPAATEINDDRSNQLAHDPDNFSCYACHTSWTTSCFGCHLPMRANWEKKMLHNEGKKTRNYTNYNFQTLRDDVYMLGIDGTVKGNKVVPIRSACAVMVSSQDANRNWLYLQQQTVSAEGYAGTAFSPYFPHNVRTTETKQCTDCHISEANDNNAVMAQLLLHGTNAANFMGRYVWVAGGKGGLEGVVVAEREEPQAVIGSRLHEIVFADWYKQHVDRGLKLAVSHDHHGTVLDLQARGEYLYAAGGKDGVIIYDIANIDNKGFSERIVTAPVSPLGQRLYVKTKYATSVISPSTLAVDPTRPRLPENEEGRISRYEWDKEKGKLVSKVETESKPHHLMYAFLYATDKYEGLVVIGNPLSEKKNKPGVATLLDGDPDNNFIKKALSFNPNGELNNAVSMTFHGHHGYVCTDTGIKVVNLDNPLDPKLIATPGLAGLRNPKKVQFQFRYGFVVDDDGLKVIDVTDVENPQLVGGTIPLADARDVYLSRTYAYVAAGKDGLVIVDIERAEEPKMYLQYTEGGMNDANAVRIAMTNNSLYAYVADGKNGLKVLQLTDSSFNHATPGFNGFSPPPQPRLIAWRKTHGPALSISEGLDRDRAVDEAGNQLSVFGRRGARPFDKQEQEKLYLRPTADGRRELYKVTNDPVGDPLPARAAPARPGGARPATTRPAATRPR